jgi:aspartyl-tRNA(Asn)/glutamyl-tRNA(Gln) amidotransferase subunit A
VEDVALVLEVIAGADEKDSTVSQKPVPSYSTELKDSPQKRYKVAYVREIEDSEGLQPEIRESILAKINEIRLAGHDVHLIDFPLMEYVLPTYYILATAEASSNLSRYDGVRYGYRSNDVKDLGSLYKKSRSEGFGKEVQSGFTWNGCIKRKLL